MTKKKTARYSGDMVVRGLVFGEGKELPFVAITLEHRGRELGDLLTFAARQKGELRAEIKCEGEGSWDGYGFVDKVEVLPAKEAHGYAVGRLVFKAKPRELAEVVLLEGLMSLRASMALHTKTIAAVSLVVMQEDLPYEDADSGKGPRGVVG